MKIGKYNILCEVGYEEYQVFDLDEYGNASGNAIYGTDQTCLSGNDYWQVNDEQDNIITQIPTSEMTFETIKEKALKGEF